MCLPCLGCNYDSARVLSVKVIPEHILISLRGSMRIVLVRKRSPVPTFSSSSFYSITFTIILDIFPSILQHKRNSIKSNSRPYGIQEYHLHNNTTAFTSSTANFKSVFTSSTTLIKILLRGNTIRITVLRTAS